MVRDFQKICAWRFSGHKAFHLFFQIARKQCTSITQGDQQGQRVIILRLVSGLPVWWRREHANLCSAPIECLSSGMLADSHVIVSGDLKKLLQCFSLRVDSNPKLGRMKILNNARKASDVVSMRMREHNHVKILNATGP